MKLGFNEATCMKKSTVEKDLEYCEKYGYDYIELRIDMLKDYLTRHSIEDLKKFFNESHIKPFAFNSIENINFCNEKEWEKVIELFEFGCKISKEIGNRYIIVVPTMGDDMPLKSEKEVFDDSLKALNTLADIAKPYDVKIAFEPIGDTRWCCQSLRQGLEIINAVNRDNVGLALDCINFYMNDKCADISFIKKIPLEKLFVFHINDCEDLPFGILDHCHRLYPGDGIIPVKEITDILKEIGYTEIASVELFRPEYWELDPAEVIKICAEKTRQFL